VIATGGRPQYLDFENSNLCITSDDIFFHKDPKKTLIVGGGYIAVETAGFLSGLKYDTTLMTRGKFLRDFDHDVAN
jgi:pyruvate/2-oxoglutarate dehydrogenase complex dihydrolipoamide dehydrogenase (E3) component